MRICFGWLLWLTWFDRISFDMEVVPSFARVGSSVGRAPTIDLASYPGPFGLVSTVRAYAHALNFCVKLT